jgi:hypothetical protein
MNVNGLVSKYLKSQGIVTKKSDLGLNFSFQGWNFLLWNDRDDPMLFRLTLPGVFDVTDSNYAQSIMACNNINWNFKVVKAVLYEYEDGKEKGASVWMCYEQQVDTIPDWEPFVNRAIHSLFAAYDAFIKEMNVE